MENKSNVQDANTQHHVCHKNKENGSLIAGMFMIAVGLIFLADHFLHIGFRHLWPILLLVVGVLLIKSAYDKPKSDGNENDTNYKK
jgi:hypothetical protein